jgi:hypothetical protein
MTPRFTFLLLLDWSTFTSPLTAKKSGFVSFRGAFDAVVVCAPAGTLPDLRRYAHRRESNSYLRFMLRFDRADC